MRSPAWVALVEVIRAQVEGRLKNMRNPLRSADGVYEQEFQKGEVLGMETVLSFPDLLMEVAKSDIEQKESKDEVQ